MRRHCFIDRRSGKMIEEKPLGDKLIHFLYSSVREKAPFIFNLAISKHTTKLLKYIKYNKSLTNNEFLEYCNSLNIDTSELYEVEKIKTIEDLFMRKIRYWETRPMDEDINIIVSPADSKMVVGSLYDDPLLLLKNKFFTIEELLYKIEWIKTFADADYAIFRLTPDEYHYNHLPVSGVVLDHYELDGVYHSCNPEATVAVYTPLSKNRRVVTIIDTDVPNGSGVGIVAFIEVVAMMIGQICQAYSEVKYDDPKPLTTGQFVKKGQPKSVYKPGSSTDLVLFEKGRVTFDEDILLQTRRSDVDSRYSMGFKQPLVEVRVRVRERIATNTKSKH
ncbi:MAG: phosphatidylserine decarboxylase [Calditerrivibrio sp.]|nr:phosphatidylserine decarboxylase [Calditerrivibrio sp.]